MQRIARHLAARRPHDRLRHGSLLALLIAVAPTATAQVARQPVPIATEVSSVQTCYATFEVRSTDGTGIVGAGVEVPLATGALLGRFDGGGTLELPLPGHTPLLAVVRAAGHQRRLARIDPAEAAAQAGHVYVDVTLPQYRTIGGPFAPGLEPDGGQGTVELETTVELVLAGESVARAAVVAWPAGHFDVPYVVELAVAAGADFDPFGPSAGAPRALVGELHVRFLRWAPGLPEHLTPLDSSVLPAPGGRLEFEPLHADGMFTPAEVALWEQASEAGLPLGAAWRYDDALSTWAELPQASVDYDADSGRFVVGVPGFSGYCVESPDAFDVYAALDALGFGEIYPAPEVPEITLAEEHSLECEYAGSGDVQCGQWAGGNQLITKGTAVEKQVTLQLSAEIQSQLSIQSGAAMSAFVADLETQIGAKVGGSLTGTVTSQEMTQRNLGFGNGDLVTANPCMAGEGRAWQVFKVQRYQALGITVATVRTLTDVACSYTVEELDHCSGCDIHTPQSKVKQSPCGDG